MTIIESRPNDLIQVKLKFFKPFSGNSLAEFTFNPEGNQTVVTWSMTGQNNFMAKAVHLFMNMDKMNGGQFEKGLAEMKSHRPSSSNLATCARAKAKYDADGRLRRHHGNDSDNSRDQFKCSICAPL
jgi:hypothetical protein